MAETVSIIDLQINQEEVIEQLEKLQRRIKETKEEIGDLNTSQEELRKSGKVQSQQYRDNQAQLELLKANQKGLNTEYRNTQNVLVKLVSDENQQLGTLEKLQLSNKRLREEQRKLNLETKEGQKRNKEIVKQIDKNTDAISENSDQNVKNKINVGNYQSALEGLPGPLGNAVSGMQRLTKSALKFIATPIGAIIAALVIAITAITKGFKNSQPAMDKFRQITDMVSAAIKVVLDRISDFVEKGLNLFNKEARKAAKEAKKLNDEMLGIDDTMSRREKRQLRNANKPSLIEEIKAEAKQAGELTKSMQGLEDAEISYIMTKAKLTREIEKNRLLAKDENLTDKERLKALDKAIETQNILMADEVKFAKERARISQERIDQGKATREEEKENAELQAKVIEVETDVVKRQRDVASERLSLIRKINAEEKKAAEEKKKRLDDELKALQDIIDEEIQAELERNERLEEFENERVLFNLDQQRQLREAAAENDFEAKKIALENQYELEIEEARKRNADLEAINKRYAIYEIQLEKEKKDAKLSIISGFTNSLGALFNEQTAIGKAAAIASTTIDTYRGAQAAFAQTPGGIVIKSLAAGTAVATGLANVKRILKVNPGSTPSISGGDGASTGSGSVSPSFSSGILAARDLTQDATQSIKEGFSAALQENPLQPVLVTDQVTAKQRDQESVQQTAVI